MKYIPPKFERLADMAGIDVSRLTEQEARKILEDLRWPDGIKCTHCGSNNVTRLKSNPEKTTRDGVIQCNACRQQFSVTHGTVMEDSHITLRQWIQAFHFMSSSKKGISALQLKRELGLHSYQSAWHLAHRIREAMSNQPLSGLLKGVIEVDETYIGGKPKKGGDEGPNKRGRGTKKAPVLAMVERKGKVISRPIENVTAKTLKSAIREVVDKESTIMTDEWPCYQGIGKEFKGGHKTVNHGTGEYVNGDAYTNNAESYFALLKRGVHGTFHHISKKHLSRYCNEFSFRWDNRKVNDGERTVEAVKGMQGKRLMLRDLVGKSKVTNG